MKLTGISVGELQLFLKLLKVADEIEKDDLYALYDYMVENNMKEISGDYDDYGLRVDVSIDDRDVYYTARTLLAELVDEEDYGSIQIPIKSIAKFIHWWNKELHVTIGDE